MSDEAHERSRSVSRRGLLKQTAAAGMVVSGSGVLSGRVIADSAENTTVLGDFEEGPDGWQTNGGNDLEHVGTGAVHKLKVDVRGDAHPMIENKKRVRRADFSDHPFLFATVTHHPVAGTGSDIVFQFRYHHGATPAGSAGGGNRGSGGRSSNEKPVLVEESPRITVPQFFPRHLVWDMRDLADEKLASPSRLEIAWFLRDHPPRGGPRGRDRAFEYRGTLTFGTIRLSDSRSALGAARLNDAILNLKYEHGYVEDTVVSSATASRREGELVFRDGTTVPTTLEIVAEDKLRYVVDGEEFKVGGGW